MKSKYSTALYTLHAISIKWGYMSEKYGNMCARCMQDRKRKMKHEIKNMKYENVYMKLCIYMYIFEIKLCQKQRIRKKLREIHFVHAG